MGSRLSLYRVVLALLLVTVMVLCLSSCSRNQSGEDTTGRTYRVGVTLLTKSHPFYQEMEAAMKETAGKLGVKLNIQSAENRMDDQQTQIENFITQGVDAIVVCPVDSDTIAGAITRANNANIPVFTADIAANGGDVVCHVASDNVQGGRLAGKYMAEKLNGKGKVVIIDHPKVMSVRDRTKGFREEIAKFPGIKIVSEPPAEGMRSQAMSVMETILQSNPDINGVFGINDDTALGALAALRQAKREDIVIIGYDGDPEARKEMISGGPLKADAVQYPREIGATTIEMVVKHLNGEAVPSVVPVEVGLIDQASLLADSKPE